eukprot:CAMPEP_0115857896 /NCGR_PEP_ID=MMETSP0287-20121206/15813_1 /TAXON_ID=412157 /ORGANISM="Chrysochromulina rotalis, Strain UIO044" /LENGTH=287 /DNA_ID=CAMNT_0003312133 /DNA_START=15 /DNA_END=879 /DNA_ORIENTATION=-
MGKGRSGKTMSKGIDDDDALLDAAIAENRVIKEKATRDSAAAAAATAAAEAAVVAALDKLPLFAVANKDGQPLRFKMDAREPAVFFADLEAAKAQRAETKKQQPDCDLIAVGLGSAYKLSLDGRGTIVPGIADLRAAGAPADAQPLGQELPLFGCTKLSRYGDEGLIMPLFMSHADCAAAVEQATNPDADDPDDAPITPLSLQSVIEQLCDPSSPAFSFMAPKASVQHVEHYVGSGVYMRVVEEAPEEAPEDAPPLLPSGSMMGDEVRVPDHGREHEAALLMDDIEH